MGSITDSASQAFYVEVGKRISHFREARKMSQEQFAKRTGFKRTSVSNIERGRQQILAHTLCLFAMVLEVNASDLLPLNMVASPEQPTPTRSNSDSMKVIQVLEKAGLIKESITKWERPDEQPSAKADSSDSDAVTKRSRYSRTQSRR